jgi:simple sugar transport system permease protein
MSTLDIDISAREDNPAWLTYGAPVFTVVAALAVSSVALLLLPLITDGRIESVSPIAAYSEMFISTMSSPLGIEQTIVRSVPLILTGLAVYFPLRAGLWNIGAEGQLFMGALVGTWIGLNVSLPLAALIPVMLIGAGLAGAIWGGIPGYLRAKYDVNEIITTLLLVFVAQEITNYMVRGPMKGDGANFPVTNLLPNAALLPDIGAQIPGFGEVSVHAGIVVALLLGLITWYIVNKTRYGFAITFTGSNHEAAKQGGMNTTFIYVLVLLMGGFFAGVAGIGEIAGVQDRLRPAFSNGYGFTAIPIALLGRNGAWQVTLAAVFFALLFVGGSNMEITYGVPAALIEVIQALIILFLITAEFFKRYEVDVSFGEPAGEATAAEGDL